LTAGLISCNNSDEKNESPIMQTDTSNMSQMTKSDTSGMHHVMESGEVYTCKMHNEVMGDKPGVCPKCGMTLVKQKMTDAQMKMMKEGTFIKPKY
jgi:rubrerythrin